MEFHKAHKEWLFHNLQNYYHKADCMVQLVYHSMPQDNWLVVALGIQQEEYRVQLADKRVEELKEYKKGVGKFYRQGVE
jgi:hypothetical protein